MSIPPAPESVRRPSGSASRSEEPGEPGEPSPADGPSRPEEHAEEPQEPAEGPEEQGPSASSGASRGLRVLLVEDNPGERWLFSEILRSRGHTVVACEDAETAWEAYRHDPVPLALLDWILPGIDGLELCRRIRDSDHGERTVVVMVTARNDPEALETVLEAGADDYVSKPVDVALMNVRLAVAEKAAEVRADRLRSQEILNAVPGAIEAPADGESERGDLELARSISRNLRSPLRTVMELARALLEEFADDLPPEARDDIRRIITTGERAEELIADVLAEKGRRPGG